jgi:hypothetical protein
MRYLISSALTTNGRFNSLRVTGLYSGLGKEMSPPEGRLEVVKWLTQDVERQFRLVSHVIDYERFVYPGRNRCLAERHR